MPWRVGGKTKGVIARFSMMDTERQPATKATIEMNFRRFVSEVRDKMRSGSDHRVDPSIRGSGPMKIYWVAKGRPNPHRGEDGMVEIILYAPY
jgi:hypothetical protein